MRTAPTAAALAAAVLAFGAAPALAMDNPVKDSRAKIERVLGDQYNSNHYAPKGKRKVVVSTKIGAERELNRYELAHYRLFGSRSGPSGR